ncbi:hypothetical protein Droror1_Dr00020253, partial [Drosera rotundifolia]
DSASDISSVLCGSEDSDSLCSSDTQELRNEKSYVQILQVPWFSSLFHTGTSQRRKELSRDRKVNFKNTVSDRCSLLVTKCAEKLGPDATIEVLGRVGRATGLKEYNALIRLCIETGRKTEDEDIAMEQYYKAYQLFSWMKEKGFEIEEQTYGPFLMYLIDMHMKEEFYHFLQLIKDANSFTRFGYYEMLLSIETEDEDKIHELLSEITLKKCKKDLDPQYLVESYLMALCERDRKKELLELLEVVDIAKLSLENIQNILRSLGRLSLQSVAKKFILTSLGDGGESEQISDFICSFATSMENLAVVHIILKYKDMHTELEVLPSSSSYERLIKFCIGSREAHLALDVVDQMCEAGFSLSSDTLNSILHACEESSEFCLVRGIYSAVSSCKLKPNSETFRSMISLSVRMKDYVGAYDMLMGLEKVNVKPMPSMYNAIMGGYFREGNLVGGYRVLEEMEKAGVKPDYQTYSYLINNCKREKDIIKYYDRVKSSGLTITKHIFMALINAYANCGKLEKAKKVIFDDGVPAKNINEIRSALLMALASNGKISDALEVYDKVRESGSTVEPKALVSLVEHMESAGQLPRLLQILDELTDTFYWIDGCSRVILYCVRHKDLRSAVDLLKKLKDAFNDDELAGEVLFDEVFSQIVEMEPSGLQLGLDMLQMIKKELKIRPSRKCLDFLLSACASAKDAKSALLIWKEYEMAGLPYNLVTSLKMYQALMASSDFGSAAKVLTRIPKDDSHVRSILLACEAMYGKPIEKDIKDKIMILKKKKRVKWLNKLLS